MPFGDKIRDLVERAHDEIDELQLGNRPQSHVAHSACRPDNSALADRRIDYSLPAEPLQQSFARLKCPAVYADILSEQHHRGVPLHLLKHRLLDGFEKRDLRSVRLRHGYFRAFLVAPEVAAAFVVFFANVLASALEPFFFTPSASGLSIVFFVSPK